MRSFFGGDVVVPGFVGETGAGGIFVALPEVGRSERPPLLLGVLLRVGIPDTESVRRLEGLCDVMVTSSDLAAAGVAFRVGRLRVCRSSALAGEFSLRIGDPRRVGVGICVGFVGDGVRGEALLCRVPR